MAGSDHRGWLKKMTASMCDHESMTREPKTPKPLYLESMDSTRSPWVAGVSDEMSAARLQAFIESLIALAFGRSIVIQQSFAFDSYAFQKTFYDIDRAYQISKDSNRTYWETQPPPVQLHLFGAATFKQAILKILGRAGKRPKEETAEQKAVPPFSLSLYPEINEQAFEEVDQLAAKMARGNLEPFLELVGQERSQMFRRLWDTYAHATPTTPTVLTPNPSAYISIDQMLAPIVRQDSDLWGELSRQELLDQISVVSTIESVQKLKEKATIAEPFKERSRLYGSWPWSASGKPAEAIVGTENIDLVREAVNTLYNRVTHNSIGSSADGFFTTPLIGPDTTAGLFQAQQVALASELVARRQFAASHQLVTPEPDEELLPSLLISGPSDTPRKIVSELFNSHAAKAFEKILAARTTASWKKGLLEIAGRRLTGDASSMRAAELEHLRRIADALSYLFTFDETTRGLKAYIPRGGLTGFASSTATQIPEALMSDAAATGATLEVAMVGLAGFSVGLLFDIPRYSRLYRRVDARRQLMSAFGDYINTDGV